MIKEAIGTGKTVDIAIENACTQIGFAREEVNIEVLALPRKAFLGLFGGNIAKVRVSIELVATTKPAPKPAPKAAPNPAPKAAPKMATPQAPPRQAPQAATQTTPPTPVRTPATVASTLQASAPTQVRPQPVEVEEEAVLVAEGSKGAIARDYLSDVIAQMGIENCTVTGLQQERTIILKLEGDATGIIIGKRGETLDALQYLSALASNRAEGDFIRVVIDSGNYRQRRQQTLEQLAEKLAASVLRSGRNATLEPMNPYERRIIHAAISSIEGVKSVSVGDEPNRCVVITTTQGVVTPSGGQNKGRRPNYPQKSDTRSGARPPHNGPRKPYLPNKKPAAPVSNHPYNGTRVVDKPAQPAETAPHKAPLEAADKPLYGKIEI